MVKTKYKFEISFQDYPVKDIWSIVVYFVGCIHNCLDCQNKELQDHNQKEDILVWKTPLDLFIFLKGVSKQNRTRKIVLSGGDPLFNLDFIKNLLKINEEEGSLLQFCIYTGYSKEYCFDNGLTGFDFLVCDKFDISKSVSSFSNDFGIQLASTNQRIFNKDYELVSEKGYYKY